jgi:mRNA-degrading endonuclease YafQ of YafQ-DinJ toxin-antitoxin module
VLRSDLTRQFKKDYKRVTKRGWDTGLVERAIRLIIAK